MLQLVVFYRVLVTGVLADRSPVELHFFRNYYPPGHELDQVTTKFQPPPRPDGKCSERCVALIIEFFLPNKNQQESVLK